MGYSTPRRGSCNAPVDPIARFVGVLSFPMRSKASVALLTPRAVAVATALFVVGAGFGLLGAAVMPVASARGAAPATPDSALAVHEAAVAECVPASLERRAAQVLFVGLPGVTTASDATAQEVAMLGVGGFFFNDSNVVDAVQVRALADGLRASSPLPPLITTDEESGRVSTFRAIIGATSSPRTLATSRTSDDVRAYAADLGGKLAQMGLDSDLAPVADLDAGPSAGVIGDRSFSADPMAAAEYAEAFALGLTDAGLVPVVKHFPGHGSSVADVHHTGAVIGTALTDLMATDVQPFVGLIEAGAPVVMVGHPTYTALDPELPASMSPTSYRLLRQLGFKGVAMTDSIGMGAIHRRWDFPRAAVKALRAGADAVLSTDGRESAAMVKAIVRAVEKGALPESRLDKAVARVLTLKGIDPAELTCATAPEIPAMARATLAARG